jgi:hypothetical protein
MLRITALAEVLQQRHALLIGPVLVILLLSWFPLGLLRVLTWQQ